jgi:hypothetical protein
LANLVVNAVFIAYFGRPAAFAISAARWSGVDRRMLSGPRSPPSGWPMPSTSS